MKRFKKLDEPVYTTDTYNDLFDGEIDPRELLTDINEAAEVAAALNLIQEFLEAAEEAGVIEVG